MDREQILDVVKSLSASQGMYGRLYNFLTDGSDEAEDYLTELENANLANSVDLVMYIES